MEPLELSHAILDQISAHAEREYPNECCGMILAGDGPALRVRECENAQDRFHELEPEKFPRTSANAYYFDPKELLTIDRELRERREWIHTIYHSHPDADAYFSQEDELRATWNGEALYPNANQLVISVLNGNAGELGAFRWENSDTGFRKVDIRIG